MSFFCDRDRIQTCNRLIRSQLLYSVELRGHIFFLNGCKGMDIFYSVQAFDSFFYIVARNIFIA